MKVVTCFLIGVLCTWLGIPSIANQFSDGAPIPRIFVSWWTLPTIFISFLMVFLLSCGLGKAIKNKFGIEWGVKIGLGVYYLLLLPVSVVGSIWGTGLACRIAYHLFNTPYPSPLSMLIATSTGVIATAFGYCYLKLA